MSTKKSAEERAEERYPDDITGLCMYKTPRPSWTCRENRAIYATCIREEVEPLEADNAKLRALVQRLVNALGHLEVPRELFTDKVKAAVLAMDAAKEHGFVPTNTTEG